VDNGKTRGPVVIRGSNIVPVTNVTLTNIDMWTMNGNEVIHQCYNVYGTGVCAGNATQASVSNCVTSTTPPIAYTSPVSPAWGISGYGYTIPIPVYTPAPFWTYSAAGSQGAATTTTGSPIFFEPKSATAVDKTHSSSMTKLSSNLSVSDSTIALKPTSSIITQVIQSAKPSSSRLFSSTRTATSIFVSNTKSLKTYDNFHHNFPTSSPLPTYFPDPITEEDDRCEG